MGLTLRVGCPKHLDRKGRTRWLSRFKEVNQALAAAGLPPHSEPTDLGGLEPLECEMVGYHGLHYLRRIAAHLWHTGTLPPPGDRDHLGDDPIIKKYYAETFDLEAPFQHLMYHSDAQGFYLPQRFNKWRLARPGDIWRIGSSSQLLSECEALSEVLAIPADDDPELMEWLTDDPYQTQGKSDLMWQNYGYETYTCLQLLEACQLSTQTGAAVVFD
jgi:hypothetical protein